jgi:hypothetical protein
VCIAFALPEIYKEGKSKKLSPWNNCLYRFDAFISWIYYEFVGIRFGYLVRMEFPTISIAFLYNYQPIDKIFTDLFCVYIWSVCSFFGKTINNHIPILRT